MSGQTTSPTPSKPDSDAQTLKISTPSDTNPPAQTPPDSPKSASHPHIRFGGLAVGAGYNHVSGREYWAGTPFYRYDPPIWAPIYHPGYYTGFAYAPNLGGVKIEVPDKTSLVFLDGALAGRLDKLKELWLEPGVYELELRNSTHHYTQKIYVLSGKSQKVSADMMADEVVR